MRLAEIFGEPNVDKFAASLSSHQLTEWMAFDTIEPMGNHRLDLLATLIQYNDYTLHTGGKGKAPPSDFFPNLPIYKAPVEKGQPKNLHKKIMAGFAMMAACFSKKPAAPPKRTPPRSPAKTQARRTKPKK